MSGPNCFRETLSLDGRTCMSNFTFCLDPGTPFCVNNFLPNLTFSESSCCDQTLDFSTKFCINSTLCFTDAKSTCEEGYINTLCVNRHMNTPEIVATVIAVLIGVAIMAMFLNIGTKAIGAYNSAVEMRKIELEEKMKEWKEERDKKKAKEALEREREREKEKEKEKEEAPPVKDS